MQTLGRDLRINNRLGSLHVARGTIRRILVFQLVYLVTLGYFMESFVHERLVHLAVFVGYR